MSRNLLKPTIRWITDHSSMILTGVGTVGVVVTAFFSAKASPKALHLIDIAEKEKGSELTRLEKFRAGAPAFIPTATSGAITIGSIVGAGIISHNNQAALASLVATGELALKEYQNKVVETIGEKNETTIQESIRRDHLDKVLSAPESAVGINRTGHGDELFLDMYSGRLFTSSRTALERGANEYNKKLTGGVDTYASVNDFYNEYYVNLPQVSSGNLAGFTSNRLLELGFQYEEPNRIYTIMYFKDGPYSDFMERS